MTDKIPYKNLQVTKQSLESIWVGPKIQTLDSVTLTAKLLVSGRVMITCPFESDRASFFPAEINLNAPPEVDENTL